MENLDRESMTKILGGGVALSIAAADLALKVVPAAKPPTTDAFAQAPPAGGAETGGFNPNMFGD